MAKKGTVNVKPAKNVQNNVIKSNQGNKKLGTTTTTPKKMTPVKGGLNKPNKNKLENKNKMQSSDNEDEDSEQDESSSVSSEESATLTKEKKRKMQTAAHNGKKAKKEEEESDSDESESDSDESADSDESVDDKLPPAKNKKGESAPTKTNENLKIKPKLKPSKSINSSVDANDEVKSIDDESDDESDDEDSDDEDSDDEDSDDESDDEEEEEETDVKQTVKNDENVESSDEEESDDESDDNDDESDDNDDESEEEESENMDTTDEPTNAQNKKRSLGDENGSNKVSKKIKKTEQKTPANSESSPVIDNSSEDQKHTVIVTNLSWGSNEDSLKNFLESCGTINKINIVRDNRTGRSRGFGYVEFSSPQAVQTAISMSGSVLDSREVRIAIPTNNKKNDHTQRTFQNGNKSQKSSTLFIGNLSWSVTEDTIRDSFSEHGNIVAVRLPTDRESGKPKGFGYIEFSTTDDASKALESLNGMEIEGRSIRLDYSAPRSNNNNPYNNNFKKNNNFNNRNNNNNRRFKNNYQNNNQSSFGKKTVFNDDE